MTARSPVSRAQLARCLAALSALALLAPTSTALAGDKERDAQSLFVEAMKLMSKKQFADACQKLARSQELDPGMGTQFRLAECYEKLGRLASAYDQYNAVADAAKAAKKADREGLAKRRAAALEPKVARLTISVPPSVAALPGLEVTRDGVEVDAKLLGSPIPVDPGDHIVHVKAPGKKPFEGKVWADVSSKLVVTVGALEDLAPPIDPDARQAKSLVPTIAFASAGGLGMILGFTFVGLRAGRASEAESLHDKIVASGNNCVAGAGKVLTAACASLAKATSRGDTYGTVSLVSFIAGGASLVAMATYLLVPAPKLAQPARTGFVVAPVMGAGEAGVAAWGRF